MNASFRIACRLSFRRAAGCVAVTALLTLLVAACDKKSDAPAPAGSAAGTAAAAAAGGAKPKATLKIADVRAAYKAQMDDTAKMKDPMDKKVDAFVAKLGKPTTDSGRKKVWYALDGDKCVKVELDTKDGSIVEQNADKSDCGM